MQNSDDDIMEQDTAFTSSPGKEATELFKVCLQVPRGGVTLVPYGHSRFCLPCADVITRLWERLSTVPHPNKHRVALWSAFSGRAFYIHLYSP